jgi:acetyl esterase/lipase
VVLIHGGFWRPLRDLSYFGHAAADLTLEGFATWNIEYRRIGEGTCQDTMDDVRRAVAHLRDDVAPRHNLDLDRVVVVGHSAGGHLALWLATHEKRLRGIVSLGGVADLRRGWELKLGDGVVAEFLGGSPEEVPEWYRTASPIESTPLGVPSRLIHGTLDESVPIEISERFVVRAAAGGDDSVLFCLPGTDHFDLVDPVSRVWPHVVATIRSLARV